MLVLAIIFIAISLIVFGILFYRFFHNFHKYRYMGNSFINVGICYILCLAYTMTLKFTPINGVDALTGGLAFTSSFFDAIKMMVGSFDVKVLQEYASNNDIGRIIYAYAFVVTSIGSLVTTSLSVILGFFFQFKPKITNFFGDIFHTSRTRENVFIFTEPRVKMSIRLAEKLRDSGDFVRIIVSRKSQSTQEGTEFKNRLVMEGFDVWTENASSNFASYIIKRFWRKNPKARHKTLVYGLFDSDEANIRYANQFEKAFRENKRFNKIHKSVESYNSINKQIKDLKKLLDAKTDENDKNELQKQIDTLNSDLAKCKKYLAKNLDVLENIRVFLTYQDFDCNCIYKYDVETLGIINSISEYEIVSTDFVMHNPVSNFVNLESEMENPRAKLDNMNVHFFGFGHVNQAIFEKMTPTYQLFGDNDNKIRYIIHDMNADAQLEKLKNIYNDDELAKEYKDEDKYFKFPHLYDLEKGLAGKDINNQRIIDEYIRNLDTKKHFKDNGFEMFIVSCGGSNINGRIAYFIRNAILANTNKDISLKKTVIFARMSKEDTINVFMKNGYVLRQSDFERGFHEKEELPVCPIVIIGEDAFISNYVHNHYRKASALSMRSNSVYEGEVSADKLLAQRVKWVSNKKWQVLDNLAPLWQIKTKLNVMGYSLDGNYNLIKLSGEKASLKEFDNDFSKIFPYADPNLPFRDRKITNQVGVRLLEMEHNRWMAQSYILHGYRPLEKSLFLKSPMNTKGDFLATHICMTTNAGLKDLYKFVSEDKEVFSKYDKEEIERVVYDYDYGFLKNISFILGLDVKEKK